jgi:penicillin-binding protein 1C
MEQQGTPRKSKARIWAAAAAGLLLLGALLVLAGLALLKPAPVHEGLEFSRAVFDKRGRLVRLNRTADDRLRLWTPLREVSPLMRRATELQEQQAARSLWASPLATSVAALRYGGGRFKLALRAWQLEASYDRDELLEQYLNLAGYGGAIQGVGAAALIYYDKNADQLNLSEALTLSVIPRHPVRLGLSQVPNRVDQQERSRARDTLSKQWKRPAAAPAPLTSQGRLDVWRRLVRQAGDGPLVSFADKGLMRLGQTMDERALEARLAAGESRQP